MTTAIRTRQAAHDGAWKPKPAASSGNRLVSTGLPPQDGLEARGPLVQRLAGQLAQTLGLEPEGRQFGREPDPATVGRQARLDTGGARGGRVVYGMQQRFEQIYATSEWGSGSGEGSAPIHTRGYARFLRRFLRTRRIRSVVDLGCGDWQFSRLIDWTGIEYRGYDIVPDVVERNDRMFSAPNVRFQHFSKNWSELPDSDLLIVKDVVQHWSIYRKFKNSFTGVLRRELGVVVQAKTARPRDAARWSGPWSCPGRFSWRTATPPASRTDRAGSIRLSRIMMAAAQ